MSQEQLKIEGRAFIILRLLIDHQTIIEELRHHIIMIRPLLIAPLILATCITAFLPPPHLGSIQAGFIDKKCDKCKSSITLYMTNQDNDNDEYDPRDNF